MQGASEPRLGGWANEPEWGSYYCQNFVIFLKQPRVGIRGQPNVIFHAIDDVNPRHSRVETLGWISRIDRVPETSTNHGCRYGLSDQSVHISHYQALVKGWRIRVYVEAFLCVHHRVGVVHSRPLSLLHGGLAAQQNLWLYQLFPKIGKTGKTSKNALLWSLAASRWIFDCLELSNASE